ncbi:MAG: asparagine synthase (glutamine-hydrolyzing) [Acidobacteriota bacterium]
MCGIAGVVGPSLNGGDTQTLGRIAGLLGHRGPDSSGLWSGEGAQLAHARLSILDLSEAGSQPMGRDGLQLVYNGEIYNFRELRGGLEASHPDSVFRSQTDSEVLLESFRRRGAACLPELRGMFAFAVWNEREKSLFLARDAFGIKPLYYRPSSDGGLAFASELAPLLELGQPEVDASALRDYLFYGYVPSPKTAWRGIFKLPAAHFLTWRDGEFKVERYWRLEPGERLGDPEQIVRQTRDWVDRAVSESMVSDVPVGVFLSGGVDSGAVAAFCRGSLEAFTLGQRQRHRDESQLAAQLASHLGLQHHVHPAESITLDDALDHVVRAFGEPFGDSGALSVWLISRFASQHVKVVLGGDGGDELFCGYRWYGEAAAEPASLARSALRTIAPVMTKLYRSSARRAAAPGFDRFAAFVGTFVPSQIDALAGPALEPGRQEDPHWRLREFWREDLPLRQRLQYADIHTLLADRMLPKVDRASMAWSLEVRPPLLDTRLASFALSVDPETLRDPASDRGKMNLRRAIESRLPAGYLDQPKKGFNLAIARWVKNDPEPWRGALARLTARGYIRRHRFMDLTNEQTWSLLVLDRWLATYQSGYRDVA